MARDEGDGSEERRERDRKERGWATTGRAISRARRGSEEIQSKTADGIYRPPYGSPYLGCPPGGGCW